MASRPAYCRAALRASISAIHSSAFFDGVQTTIIYSAPPCTRPVREINVCAFNAHMIALSTIGPRIMSTAVFA
jgi:hypothetical protein